MVTVISVSFNHGKYVKDTVESVSRQSYRDIQHIVVDGGSTDETFSVLKNYPHVEVISGPDDGVFHAFHKGLSAAKGDYIMFCAVTDGYLDMEWIEKCVNILDANPDISLVWGLPRSHDENGKPLDVSYPQFHTSDPPQKENFVYYWLSTFFYFPEGNYCVRKNVLKECFPPYVSEKHRVSIAKIDPWVTFNDQFNSRGYLPYFIRSIANFGRAHERQHGKNEIVTGFTNEIFASHVKVCKKYRSDIVFGRKKHIFRKGDGSELPLRFSNSRLWRSLFSLRFLLNEVKIIVRPIIKRHAPALASSRLVKFIKKSG